MTQPEDLHDDPAPPSRLRTASIAAVIALLILVPFTAARPVWRLIKAHRASQFAAEARAFIEAGRVHDAANRARAALQLAPNHPDVLRINAEIATHFQGRVALSFWSQLIDTGKATPDDLAAYAEAGLRLDRSDLVRQIASNIVAQGTVSPRGERIASLYYADAGNLFQATHHARNAFSLDPANPTNAVLLADLLVADSKAPADLTEEARSLYWKVAETDPGLRSHSLRKLSGPPLGSRPDRERIVSILNTATNRSVLDDILLVEAQVSLDPASGNRLLADVVAALPRDDLPRITAVADTLRRLGRFQEILRLTAGGRERRSRGLFQARFEALLGTSQIEEAYRLTLEPEAPVPPFDLAILRVRAAARTGDYRRVDSHLKELTQAAGLHPGYLRIAAETSEELGRNNLAVEAWKILSQVPAEARLALGRLQSLTDRAGDTWTARQYASKAAATGPADDRLRLDIARYDLLLADEVERAHVEVRRQFDANPADFETRALLALAHLRDGNPEEARKLLDRQVVDASQLRPGTAAIVAAVLHANGLSTKATQLARQIPLAPLRPEERTLIRPCLIQPSLAGDQPAPRRP